MRNISYLISHHIKNFAQWGAWCNVAGFLAIDCKAGWPAHLSSLSRDMKFPLLMSPKSMVSPRVIFLVIFWMRHPLRGMFFFVASPIVMHRQWSISLVSFYLFSLPDTCILIINVFPHQYRLKAFSSSLHRSGTCNLRVQRGLWCSSSVSRDTEQFWVYWFRHKKSCTIKSSSPIIALRYLLTYEWSNFSILAFFLFSASCWLPDFLIFLDPWDSSLDHWKAFCQWERANLLILYTALKRN